MSKLLKILIFNDALPNPSVNRTGFRLNLLKLSLKLLLKFLFIKTYKIQTWIAFVVCMSCTWINWTLKTLKRKRKKKLKRSQNNLRPTSACVWKFRKGHSLAIGQISQKANKESKQRQAVEQKVISSHKFTRSEWLCCTYWLASYFLDLCSSSIFCLVLLWAKMQEERSDGRKENKKKFVFNNGNTTSKISLSLYFYYFAFSSLLKGLL